MKRLDGQIWTPADDQTSQARTVKGLQSFATGRTVSTEKWNRQEGRRLLVQRSRFLEHLMTFQRPFEGLQVQGTGGTALVTIIPGTRKVRVAL